MLRAVKRRTFLAGAAATTAAVVAGGTVAWRRDATSLAAAGATRTDGAPTPTRPAPPSGAPNVLFIVPDDCTDWLGYLNNPPATHTPNIDALARKSLSFDRAYCTAPMCLPARTGVVFGRRPYEVGVYDHTDASRENARVKLE